MTRFSPCHILLIDDNPTTLEITVEGLQEEGYSIDVASSGEEGIAKAKKKFYDIAITDIVMPGIGGMEVLAHFTKHHPDTIVIVLTGYGTIETAVEAMKYGAFDYLTKPAKLDEILLVLQRAQELKALRMENVLLRSQLQDRYGFDKIIGQSQPMQAVYRMIQRVAKTDSTVLITGESGTGKELIANAIHYHSDRKDKPFVPINCGAIPEELLESELFGYERGAFTGAVKTRKGRFELANHGTVFLDEIGEMSPKLQVKLLRFLQERKFERIGDSSSIEVDVRILAATNKNMEKAVAESEFREDLYFRLNVIPIQVPALREREGDLPLLAHHFMGQHCRKMGMVLKKISREALQCLESYEWPGNVRELENLMERLVILTEHNEILPRDLPERMCQKNDHQLSLHVELGEKGLDLKKTLEELEDRLILEALKRAGGVKNQAAKILGLKRTTLIEKMKKKKMS